MRQWNTNYGGGRSSSFFDASVYAPWNSSRSIALRFLRSPAKARPIWRDELAPFGNRHRDETCEFRRAPRRHADECSNGLDEAVTFVLDVELKLLVEKHHCATRRPALLAGEAHGGTPKQKYAAAAALGLARHPEPMLVLGDVEQRDRLAEDVQVRPSGKIDHRTPPARTVTARPRSWTLRVPRRV